MDDHADSDDHIFYRTATLLTALRKQLALRARPDCDAIKISPSECVLELELADFFRHTLSREAKDNLTLRVFQLHSDVAFGHPVPQFIEVCPASGAVE